jgi:Na+/proline symporter
VLIVSALVAIVVTILIKLPVSPDAALHLAGAVGRMRVFDFSFDLHSTYTFWSGIIGGTFLMLSYFGTDQSQVQRYLAARSVPEARSSLLISAYWKIPLQALILLVGVLVFVYGLFQTPPLYFNPAHDRAVRAAQPALYAALESRYHAAADARATAARAGDAESLRKEDAAVGAVRTDALDLATQVTGQPSRDVNYIMPRFVLDVLPLGFAGIFIAAVMAAAMSAIAAELNSLSTATVIDFYKRWFRPEGSDAHYLFVSRAATGVWGIFACMVAPYAGSLGSLIEVVNRFGSFFYGSILGVFILAMIPRARARGAFVGLIAGMTTVAAVSFGRPDIAFLWYNVIGAVAVVSVGLVVGGR